MLLYYCVSILLFQCFFCYKVVHLYKVVHHYNEVLQYYKVIQYYNKVIHYYIWLFVVWNWNFVALKFQAVFCLQMERKRRETLYINAAQFLPMVTGWNYPIKTISTDNVLKWWKGQKTGCKFFQKIISLKIKYLSVLFTYYKSEYFCIFYKWLIFSLFCINFWKMEGRVCLRVRIPNI